MREFIILIRYGEIGYTHLTIVNANNVTEAVDRVKQDMRLKDIKAIKEIRAITALDMMEIK